MTNKVISPHGNCFKEVYHFLANNNVTILETSIPELLPDHHYIRLKFLDETVQVVQAKTTDTIGEFRRFDALNLIQNLRNFRNYEDLLHSCSSKLILSALEYFALT